MKIKNKPFYSLFKLFLARSLDVKRARSMAFLLVLTFAAKAQNDSVAPYQGVPGWAESKDSRMEWFEKARFGLFIHWGLYSAAGGYWDGKKYPQHYSEWIQNWAKVPSKDYASVLKPLFTVSKFNADEWAALAEQAGMKYVIITSRHHDGFSIFNSQQSYSLDNKITGGTNISPVGRDLYGELISAFKKKGLKAGAYYSLLDWQHPDSYQGFTFNANLDNYKPDHEKYKEYMYSQIKELANNYDGLDVLWVDYSSAKLQGESWGTKRILTDLIKWQPNILVNNRFWNELENKVGDFGTPEKYVPPTGLPGMSWEASHTMNESYGYSAHDQQWKSFDQIMRLFIETVSKGGNFLLNIGPDAAGNIPPQAVALMNEVGEWMKINEESIYGTSAGPFKSLDWGYATQKKGLLYLTVFDPPKDGSIVIPLKNKIKKAYTLGESPQKLKTRKTKDEMVIDLPKELPDRMPLVIVAEIVGQPDIIEPQVKNSEDGRLILTPKQAELTSGLTTKGPAAHGLDQHDAIVAWKSTKDSAYWNIKLQKPGKYKIIAKHKQAKDRSGTIELYVNGSRLSYRFQSPTAGAKHDFVDVNIGSIDIPQESIGTSALKVVLRAQTINDILPEIGVIQMIPDTN